MVDPSPINNFRGLRIVYLMECHDAEGGLHASDGFLYILVLLKLLPKGNKFIDLLVDGGSIHLLDALLDDWILGSRVRGASDQDLDCGDVFHDLFDQCVESHNLASHVHGEVVDHP